MKVILFYILILSSLLGYDNSKTLVLRPNSLIEDDYYLDINDINSIHLIFVEELKNYMSNIEISLDSCDDDDCALEKLNQTDNEQVIYTKLQKLGSKLIFSGYVLNSDSYFSSRATAMSVEDMEAVCLRLAKSIAMKESVEDVADIENIIEKEIDEPARRAALHRYGMNAGYLFPIGDSYGDKSQILKTGISYYYEFQNNTSLIAEWHMPLEHPSMGLDLSILKFTNIVDTSPFYGMGLGIHHVYSDKPELYNSEDSAYTNTGMALNIQSGLMLFRTYDVNVLVRAKYIHVFNTKGDNSFSIDFTLQRKRSNKKKNKTEVIYKFPLIEKVLDNL